MQFFRDHSLLLLLTGAGVFSFCWFLPFRKRLGMGMIKTIFITVVLMVWGFVAARYIFPFIEAFGNVDKMANLRLYGIILFDAVGFLAVVKIFKLNQPLFFDVCAISMVACAILGRVDCFVKGCCYGIPFFDTAFRWPIREIELVANLLFFGFFIHKELKGKTHGEVYPFYMIYYGTIRFILECFRVEGDQIGNSAFHLAHLWSVISALIGVVYLMYNYEKRRQDMMRSKKRRRS